MLTINLPLVSLQRRKIVYDLFLLGSNSLPMLNNSNENQSKQLRQQKTGLELKGSVYCCSTIEKKIRQKMTW